MKTDGFNTLMFGQNKISFVNLCPNQSILAKFLIDFGSALKCFQPYGQA